MKGWLPFLTLPNCGERPCRAVAGREHALFRSHPRASTVKPWGQCHLPEEIPCWQGREMDFVWAFTELMGVLFSQLSETVGWKVFQLLDTCC